MKELYEVSNFIHGQLMKLIELMDEGTKRRKLTELIINKYREIRQLIAREGFQATPKSSFSDLGRERVDIKKELIDLQFDISSASQSAKDGDAKAFVNEELKQLRLLQREALDFTAEDLYFLQDSSGLMTSGRLLQKRCLRSRSRSLQWTSSKGNFRCMTS